MKTKHAIEYYGSAAAVARAARISRSAVAQWGNIVPIVSAMILEEESGGKLKVRLLDYKRKGPPESPPSPTRETSA